MNSKAAAVVLFRLLFLQLALLTFGLNAPGQTADLSGAITDSSHAAVPGASIAIMQESTGLKRAASSNPEGL